MIDNNCPKLNVLITSNEDVEGVIAAIQEYDNNKIPIVPDGSKVGLFVVAGYWTMYVLAND